MTRVVPFGLCVAVAALAAGCGTQPPPVPPGPALPPVPSPDLSALARKYPAPKPAAPPRAALRPAGNAGRRAAPAPFPAAGTWAPSGWMGDAHPAVGALSYRVSPGEPPADEWTYDPSRGLQRWAAVAYQWPDSNFGDRKGKDLSGKGYDRLTFKARAREGTVRVLFKSGGHTAPDARFPASYEAATGPASLGTEWKEVSIPLRGQDLSNVPAALVLVFTEQLCPRGGSVLIRDVAFRGAPE